MLIVELFGVLGLFVWGELIYLIDSLLCGGDIILEVEIKDLKFVFMLVEGIEILYGMCLEGKFMMVGIKMGMDLLLM